MKALRADSPINIQSIATRPHDRVYTWFPRLIANDPNSPTIVCGGCCDCGAAWTAGTLGNRKVAEPYRAELEVLTEEEYDGMVAEAISAAIEEAQGATAP